MSTAEGPALSVAVAGVVSNFTVQVRDIYGNKRLEGGDTVLVTVTSNSSAGVIVGNCTHRSDGLYDCFYVAQAAGPQQLEIVVAGEAIVDSPFTVQARFFLKIGDIAHCLLLGAAFSQTCWCGACLQLTGGGWNTARNLLHCIW